MQEEQSPSHPDYFPAPQDVSAQPENSGASGTAEAQAGPVEHEDKEIDLNLLFPDAETDLNALFPDPETRHLLKAVNKNKKDLHSLAERFVEGEKTGKNFDAL